MQDRMIAVIDLYIPIWIYTSSGHKVQSYMYPGRRATKLS